MKSRVVVSIYTDPDFYPPTINAILNLSEAFEEVVVISRTNATKDFPYPENVRLIKIGANCTVREMEKQSFGKKMFYFMKFLFSFLKYSKQSATRLILIYDHFALFAYHLCRIFIKHKKVWYHNHDMVNKELVSRFSIGGLAVKYEANAMKNIDFFSLPSKERLVYFSDLSKDIPVFIIPNYPSLKIYRHFKKKFGNERKIKIIYQGFIGKGHSLEEIVQLLPESIEGKKLYLTLKGSVTAEYKSRLDKLVRDLNVTEQLRWLPISSYSELPAITASCDLGVGINMNNDSVSLAQGTASNKIYEYAASGLPVLLYDSEQFRKYLDKYEWAFFTDGSIASIQKQVRTIIQHRYELAQAARKDFENGLNFETVFQPVLKAVLGNEN